MKINHNNLLNIAFNIAKINLGKTRLNPSVGCIIVKNNSVISSGVTSLNGRPHAEFNALNVKKNFVNSDMYVTMEPCVHHGLTQPCTDLIIKKGIKRVFFCCYDVDKRTARKSKKILNKKNIIVIKKNSNIFKDFYHSYYLSKNKSKPLIDAKVAISKDYYTINKNAQWITNKLSRSRVHLIRSEYDVIISTSKTINEDNSLLNCRLNGFNNSKPDLIIIDINLKIKNSLNLFKKINKRKIFIITSVYEKKKIEYLNKFGVKIIFVDHLKSKSDFIKLFKTLKDLGYNRLLVESGLIFLNELLKKNFINNLYMFQSAEKLKKKGKNNASSKILQSFKLNNKINVNLNGDNLYKIRIR